MGRRSFLKMVAFVSFLLTVFGSDPDIISDFIFLPALNGTTNVTADFFAFKGLREVFQSEEPQKFKATKVTVAEFPALLGQSVSAAVLEYPAGSVNPPHTHPRSAELLFVLQGSLTVGFVDTKNQLFSQSLQVGDLFVFPKGLVHFQFNSDSSAVAATAVSAFASANPGTVSLPATVFADGIDDNVLAKSFNTDVATIQKIKAGIAAPH
ncbi:putative germin-like protein 9-2 [Momordica charantia]|uniref:Germin-like protein n=1 Tax=Momordica charantia TaxID=3673 RepID=A0A6J1CVH3_MOMCH|nr:putative germin-like protein 9-2 [Momordica charantia]